MTVTTQPPIYYPGSLSVLIHAVRMAYPDVVHGVSEPRDPAGLWWVDFERGKGSAIVEFRSRDRWGVSDGNVEAEYGERSEVYYKDDEAGCRATLARVLELLSG